MERRTDDLQRCDSGVFRAECNGWRPVGCLRPAFVGIVHVRHLPDLNSKGTRRGGGRDLFLYMSVGRIGSATLVFRDNAPTRTLRFDTLTGTDLKAVNTFTEPNKVKPASLEPPQPGGRMVLQLPVRSYSRLLLQAAPA